MPSKFVHVLLGDNDLPVRIYRDKSWRDEPVDRIATMTREKAVGAIRAQVYDRAIPPLSDGFRGAECERCGRGITWESMEMNEIIPKGSGGEVALSNCEALCHQCHTGAPDSAHGNRRWQTSKIKSDKGQHEQF